MKKIKIAVMVAAIAAAISYVASVIALEEILKR
jgi:hypothetical protein